MTGLVAAAAFHCPVYICDGGVIGILGKRAAKHAVSSAADSVFTSFARWLVQGAAWLVARTVALITGSARVDINANWFKIHEADMARIALVLVVPLVLAATIGAIVRQDSRRLVRIYAVGIPVATISSLTLLKVAQMAVAIVDALCNLITSNQKAYAPFGNIDGDMTHHSMPIVVELIVGSVIVIAGLALWLELILRAVVVDIAVFFLPLGLAAIVWPATAHIAKRFIEMLAAVIGSKFVIVATLSLGAAMVEQHAAGVDDAIKAAAILLLAAFAPFALLRLIPVLEIAAAAQLEGMSRRPIRAAADAGAMAAGGAKGLLLSRAGGDGVEGGPVAAADIGARSADLDIGALDSSGGASTAGANGGSGGSAPSLDRSGDEGASPPSGGGGFSPPSGGGGFSPPSGGGGFSPPSGGGSSSSPPGGGGSTSPSGGGSDGGAQTGPDPADLAGPMPVLERSVPGPPSAWHGAGSVDE